MNSVNEKIICEKELALNGLNKLQSQLHFEKLLEIITNNKIKGTEADNQHLL